MTWKKEAIRKNLISNAMEIKINVKKCESIKEFISTATKSRRIGQVYYQLLEDKKGLVPRVISEATDKDWLDQEIWRGNIFLPELPIKSEMS